MITPTSAKSDVAAAAPLDRGEAAVGRDLVEPGPDEAALVEVADAPPRAHQRFLERVLGVVQRAEHPVAVGLQFAPVGRDQLLKRARVALAGGLDEVGGRSHALIPQGRPRRRDEFPRPRGFHRYQSSRRRNQP